MDNKELVGSVGLLAKTKKLAYLKRMIIKKKFRKQGLGQKLPQTALEFAKKHNFKNIREMFRKFLQTLENKIEIIEL